MTGTWVLYLPHVKEKFGLNDAEIGMALFCLALGLLISIPFIPVVNNKIGEGRSTQVGIILFALSFIFPLLVTNYIWLCSALLIVGLFSGFTDISMNALVTVIEKEKEKQFMSAAHGFFSLGGFVGASIGSLLMGILKVPVYHMILMAVFILISNFYFSKYYVEIKEEKEKANKVKTGISLSNLKPLFGLTIIAFIIMFNEGAVEHWSNLFLYDIVNVSESKAGFGFIAFSLCMTIGRFMGDEISNKIGSQKIIALGCFIAFLGYLAVVSQTFYISIVGFGVIGLGLSVVIPEIYRLAGNTKGVTASVGISVVSGLGFAGFLIGPVLLGIISNWASLVWSYIFLGALTCLALILILFRK